jgi:hypothetical protein
LLGLRDPTAEDHRIDQCNHRKDAATDYVAIRSPGLPAPRKNLVEQSKTDTGGGSQCSNGEARLEGMEHF